MLDHLRRSIIPDDPLHPLLGVVVRDQIQEYPSRVSNRARLVVVVLEMPDVRERLTCSQGLA